MSRRKDTLMCDYAALARALTWAQEHPDELIIRVKALSRMRAEQRERARAAREAAQSKAAAEARLKAAQKALRGAKESVAMAKGVAAAATSQARSAARKSSRKTPPRTLIKSIVGDEADQQMVRDLDEWLSGGDATTDAGRGRRSGSQRSGSRKRTAGS